ncbi:MAG: M28 family peptidase [Flavobacteriales bacterium]|jgi:hypothetical protein|nr:M28 family peptidase [Flavobacteriales bacterium]
MEVTGNWMYRSGTISLFVILLFGCNPNKNNEVKIEMKPAPTFNADSAYVYISDQVNFGPRVPGSESHKNCGDYLVRKLTRSGATVAEQLDSVTSYDGKSLPLRNIIASYNPENNRRVLLCAHWDTRPFADRDTSEMKSPIDGANDGASGVGVLLEIARNFAEQAPSVGVDIILFDVEDQGRPAFETTENPDKHFFCLGSHYWAKHKNTYTAEYGILLDMVGAKNAVFTMEGVSMQYAEHVLRKVWDTGNQLGYEDYFRYNRTPALVDDHNYINEIAQIPCIDIIQYDSSNDVGFGSYWHTHADNMDVIESNTLKAVGQTVLQVVYNE